MLPISIVLGACDNVEVEIIMPDVFDIVDDNKVDISELHVKAERGDAEAQHRLGTCYASSNGAPQGQDKAIEWFQKAADQGHTFAQLELGFCYDTGNGVHKDNHKAAEWYRKAAKALYHQLDRDAIPHSHREGKRFYFKLVELYRQAAEKGYAKAQYRLGLFYSAGLGADPNDCAGQNDLKAVKWLKAAADQGLTEALFELGDCYACGFGVRQDVDKAIELYRRAAGQGHAKAQEEIDFINGKREYYRSLAESNSDEPRLNVTGWALTDDEKKYFR